MAIDFPNSPTTGDTYTAGGRTWQWDGTVWASYGNYPDPTVLKIDTGTNRVGINNTSPTTSLDVTGDLTVSGTITGGSISGAGMTVSSTAPSSPSAGEMWYNDTTGRTFVYYDDGSSQQWVEFDVPPEGSTIALASYADSSARTTAIPSPTEADLSYLQDTNSVEVYDGSDWVTLGGGGWVSFTPTWANFTAGDATQSFAYNVVDKTVRVRGTLTFGSTSSFTGGLVMAAPYGTLVSDPGRHIGTCGMNDLSSGALFLGHIDSSAPYMRFWSAVTSSTYLYRGSAVQSTVPFTWTTNDLLYVDATYRIS